MTRLVKVDNPENGECFIKVKVESDSFDNRNQVVSFRYAYRENVFDLPSFFRNGGELFREGTE